MDLLNFLIGTSPDFKGRYLSDIWNYNDDEVEKKHAVHPFNKSII